DEPPYYIAMDYVPSKDLEAWCNERGGVEKVPLETRLEIVAQVADGLQAAHDAGVLHRDIKPANILVAEARTSGAQPVVEAVRVRLTDFGIGQVVSIKDLNNTKLGFTQTLTPGTTPPGTTLYWAPELLAGKPASIRSDLFALGVVLYQLV